MLVDQSRTAKSDIREVPSQNILESGLVVVKAQGVRVIDIAHINDQSLSAEYCWVASSEDPSRLVRLELLQHKAGRRLVTVESAVVGA